MASYKYRISLVLGVSFSLFFLWLAFKDTDVSAIVVALRGAELWMIVPLLVALALFYWLKAVRWAMLLQPLHVARTSAIFPASMVGCMANNILPAHLGEFVRMYLVGRQLRLSQSAVLSTVVLERLFDFLVVFCLLEVALVFETKISEELSYATYFIGVLGSGFFVLACCYLVWCDTFIFWVSKITVFLPEGVQSQLLEQLKHGATGLHAIKSPRLLWGVVVLSFVQWAIMAACLFIGVLAVGIDVPVFASLILLALSVAGVTLPSSPGFFGTIELCFVLALAPYGVTPSEAFAAAVFYHLFAYVSVTAVGLYYLYKLHLSLARISEIGTDMADGESVGADKPS